MTIFFFCFSVNVFLMDVYAEKKIIMKSFNKKEKERDYFYH